MNFKQTFTNIYNNNCNKIKRTFDNDFKSIENTNEINSSKKNIDSTVDFKRRREISSNHKERRSPSPTRRNRQNNHHFQFSNELKESLNQKSTLFDNSFEKLSPSPSSSSSINTTPIKKIIPLTVDTSNNHDQNPFITPPSSATKLNHIASTINYPTPISSTSNQNKILIKDFQSLKIKNNEQCHQIFKIPEILNNIIKYVVINEKYDLEKPYKQRPPQSYRHAIMIYKDEEKANQVWSRTKYERDHLTNLPINQRNGNIFKCLMVNKLWFQLTLPYLLKDLIFENVNKFIMFLEKFNNNNSQMVLKIDTLTFNRISDKQNSLININDNKCISSLKELKMHICPQFLLPAKYFQGFSNLQNVSITGNKMINDNYLIKISPFLKRVASLDLRACENVTDIGVVAIALNCKELKTINLGRHQHGDMITDVGLVALGKFTNVETIGFAGCEITDNGLWEFAKWNGDNVKRLSLNNCKQLTDFSIPYLLGFNYLPNISVLEIRFLNKLNDVKYIVKFKLWKRSQKLPLLIESCERITELMNKEEENLQKYNARMSLMEMTKWVNNDDGEDDEDFASKLTSS